MVSVKKGDWVELEFIGRIKNTGDIFDLTSESTAKKEGIFQKGRKYSPITVCIGAKHLINGLDKFIDGKSIGKEYEVDILPEDAFGRRNPKLIQLTGLNIFKEKNVNPVPGMQLNLDGMLATIRSVTGGRVLIDFNHPLSGKILSYWFRLNKIIIKSEDKVKALVDLLSGQDCSVSVKNKKATVTLKTSIGNSIEVGIEKQAKEFIPEISRISFKTKQ